MFSKTLSTLRTFFAAMAANPEVQKRAQEELDSVIGLDRLPTIEDKPSLPYITALMKECLRWRNVVPLSVPHVLAEDDEYKGYYLPKGSAVISNIWYSSSGIDLRSQVTNFCPFKGSTPAIRATIPTPRRSSRSDT